MTPLYFDKGKREKSRGEKISSSKPTTSLLSTSTTLVERGWLDASNTAL